MKGTIIVGKASKSGETKAMDHHAMRAKAESAGEHHHDGTEAADHHGSKTATTGGIQGTGKVVSVDAEKRTIKMAHDPIKALNWPKMTMSFPVDSNVDISSYQAGDDVSFTLNPTSKAIMSLKKGK